MRRRLEVHWCERDRDHVIDYPAKRDGHWIENALFGTRYNENGSPIPSIASKLESMGYDLSTLRFECSVKATAPAPAGNDSPEVGA